MSADILPETEAGAKERRQYYNYYPVHRPRPHGRPNYYYHY